VKGTGGGREGKRGEEGKTGRMAGEETRRMN